MNVRRKLTAALIACGLASSGFLAASASAANAAVYEGGVSVLGACENQIYTNAVALINNNVTGWRCKYKGAVISVIYYYYNIDLNAQCAYQFGSGSYAKYTNYNNPYSWGCYR